MLQNLLVRGVTNTAVHRRSGRMMVASMMAAASAAATATIKRPCTAPQENPQPYVRNKKQNQGIAPRLDDHPGESGVISLALAAKKKDL